MFFKYRFFRKMYYHIAELTWPMFFAMCFIHLSVTWVGYDLAGEDELLYPTDNVIENIVNIVYFWEVTGSTVGYGDMSPSTMWGRILTITWVIPCGIGLFGIGITKIAGTLTDRRRKRMRGEADYSNLKEHTVILGHEPNKTARILELYDSDADIVLATKKDIENPYPDRVRFVRAESLTDKNLLLRAGLKTAKSVIVLGENDDQTLAAGLAAYNITRSDKTTEEHIVAYFNNPSVGNIFKDQCPKAECINSLSVEQVVKSATDPGSSRVQRQILDSNNDDTQYTLQVPEWVTTTYGDLFYHLRSEHKATLIGISSTIIGNDLDLNADDNVEVKGGDYLTIIRSSRLSSDNVDWSKLTA